MHDEMHAYCVLYDEDSEPSAARWGDTLVMAAWPDVYASPDEYGLDYPVLVSQFIAPSWEAAMQQWNTMRGAGPYTTTCEDDLHEGSPTVKWVSDERLCANCVLRAKLQAIADEFRDSPAATVTAEKIKGAIVLRAIRDGNPPTVKQYTVSSTKHKATGKLSVNVWVVTEQGGEFRFTVHLGGSP